MLQKKPLTPSDQHAISDQVAQTLAYMHAQSPAFIHRDVKPMNILVRNLTEYCVYTKYKYCTECFTILTNRSGVVLHSVLFSVPAVAF